MRKVFLSIFVIFIIFLFIEGLFFFVYIQRHLKVLSSTNFELPKINKYTLRYSSYKDFFNEDVFRETSNFGSNNRILLFGCSYAYGSSLENEQTFAYKLANKLNSTVYNRSFPGLSPAYMLYQVETENDSLQLSKIKDVDVVIYIYTEDQINRLNNFYWGNIFENIYNLRYKLQIKDNKLEDIVNISTFKSPFIDWVYSLYVVKAFRNTIEFKFLNSAKNKENNHKLLVSILEKSNILLKQRYKNARFIFIPFNTSEDILLHKDDIINAGWEYYSTGDLLPNVDLNNDEYHFQNDPHPTEVAWELLTNAIVNKKIIY